MDKMTQKEARREFREHIIKLLYIREFHEPEEMDEQIENYFTVILENSCPEDEKTKVIERFKAICEKLPEIDLVIAEISVGWRLNRIGKVELQCLRNSVYEMKEDEEIPSKIAINEAVELAKTYGGENSHAFVNGILAKLVTEDE